MTTRNPIRLREMDPLFDELVGRAYADLPGPGTVESILHTLEGVAPPPTLPPPLETAITPLETARTAVTPLAVMAVVSSGLIWAAHTVWPTPSSPATSAPIVTGALSPTEPAEPSHVRSGDRPTAAPRVRANEAEAGIGAREKALRAHELDGARTQTTPKHAITRSPSTHGLQSTAAKLALEAISQDPSSTATTPAQIPAPPRPDPKATDAKTAAEPRNAEEVDLLADAQQALRTSPTRALELTERHRRLFPSGAFVQEREQIAIEALYDVGQLQVMHERAAHFHRAFPNSPYTARIDELVGAAH